MLYRFICVLTLLSTSAAFSQGFPSLDRLPAPPNGATGEVEAQKAELGQMLFFDARLSGDASTSCAECHSPQTGWGDGSDLSRGYPGTVHWRNSQTIVNMVYLDEGLHWDGGPRTGVDQVHDAFSTGFVANVDSLLVEERLRQIPEYVERFQAIWNQPPDMEKISNAIVAYEQTLISDDSPFDKFMSGDQNALSPSAQRGMALFAGKAGCIACHNGPLATDQNFHNTSVPVNPAFESEPLRQITFRMQLRRMGLEPDVYNALDRDPGRYVVSGEPQDLGAFRTPPLRYLKYTAPYMHNGAFFDLREVVEFYNAGGTEDVFGTKSPFIRPLGLNSADMDDLVAFLESMSGAEIFAASPNLPDYALAPFPAKPGTVTLASLQSGSTATSAAPAQASQTPAVTPLVIETVTAPASQTQQSGLQSTSSGFSISAAGSAQASQAAPAQPQGTSLQITNRVETSGNGRFVTVRPGDTLGSLASEFYGDPTQFRIIYDANRDQIDNPNILSAGTRLRLP